MTHILLSGVVLGLTLAIAIGPAFFALLQTSIHRGFKRGMFLAFGIFFSDLTLVALCYFGVSQFITEPSNQTMFGIIGGAILIGYGIWTFRKKTKIEKVDDETDVSSIEANREPGLITYVVKGYLLNLANPFLLVFWMSVVGVVSANYGTRSPELFVFFAGTLFTVIATDLLKCFVANTLKRFIRPKVLSFINHLLGILLIGCGMYLILQVLMEL